jgi:hypothetical protein
MTVSAEISGFALDGMMAELKNRRLLRTTALEVSDPTSQPIT